MPKGQSTISGAKSPLLTDKLTVALADPQGIEEYKKTIHIEYYIVKYAI